MARGKCLSMGLGRAACLELARRQGLTGYRGAYDHGRQQGWSVTAFCQVSNWGCAMAINGLMSLLLLIGLTAADPVIAQTVDPADPQSVVSALQDFGLRARLEEDSVGDPKVSSSIEGSTFNVYFYGCDENHKDCKMLNVSTGYDQNTPVSLEKINTWNKEEIVGKAFLDDEGDPYLDMVLPISGGMSADAFEYSMTRWGRAVAKFEDMIGW
jgi:hypothetical protein